jgi:hypothetical protein
MKPSMLSAVYSLVMTLIAIVCIYHLFITKNHIGASVGGIALVILVLWPYSFFFGIRQQATEILYIYGAIQSKTYTSDDIDNEISVIKWKLRMFALGNLLFSLPKSEENNGNNSNISSMTQNFANTAVADTFEVLEGYLLPAVVIDKLSIADAFQKIGTLQNHIPEALAGVFGVNFFGRALSSIALSILVLLILLGVALGYLFPHIFPAANLFVTTKFIINYFPIFWAAALGLLVNCIVNPTSQFLKSLYFTMFYVLIEKPEVIPFQEKQELIKVIAESNNINSVTS